MLLTLVVALAMMFFVVVILLVALAVDRVDRLIYEVRLSRETEDEEDQRLRREARNHEILTGEYSYP